jgi:hypothetical protein
MNEGGSGAFSPPETVEGGRVGYQCIDTVGTGADGSGCDCIHAITDMDPKFNRDYYRLTRFGEAGSRFIIRQLFEGDLLIEPKMTHPWLIAQLGLCRYPIVHRTASPQVHRSGAAGTTPATARAPTQMNRATATASASREPRGKSGAGRRCRSRSRARTRGRSQRPES